MIVDGTDQFVGNDTVHALHAIANAARAPKIELTLSSIAMDATHLTARISATRQIRSDTKADLYAAVVESMATTRVLRGENNNRTLHHVSVVRQMQRIGKLADASGSGMTFSLDRPADTPARGLRVVVFVQRPGQGAILGAIASPPVDSSASTTSIAAAQP